MLFSCSKGNCNCEEQNAAATTETQNGVPGDDASSDAAVNKGNGSGSGQGSAERTREQNGDRTVTSTEAPGSADKGGSNRTVGGFDPQNPGVKNQGKATGANTGGAGSGTTNGGSTSSGKTGNQGTGNGGSK